MVGSNTKNPSCREYNGIVLFNYSEGLKYPFKFFKKEWFDSSEIREAYYLFQLVPQSRLKILKKLKKIPNQTLSIFAKVERGEFYCIHIILWK